MLLTGFRSSAESTILNEVLAKIVCDNIRVLIQETYELGVSATFWREPGAQQELALVGVLNADDAGFDLL